MTEPTDQAKPIKVTVTDPESGEVLGEQLLENDYLLLVAGTAHLAGAQKYGNGTHVLTVKGAAR